MLQMGPGPPDTTSKSLFYGALVKGTETIATTLLARMRVYTNDQEAVNLTEDPQSAKETLQLLEVLNGQSLLAPPIKSRIEALGGLDQPVKIVPAHLTESDYAMIDQKIMNPPELKPLYKLVNALAYIAWNTPFFIAKQLMLMHCHGNKYLLRQVVTIAKTIFPTHIPTLMGPIAGLRKADDDRVQQRAKTILREMGASIPAPIVYYNDQDPMDYHVLGSPSITGESILVVSKDFQVTSSKEEFILRHEMSHLKHEDPLMKLGITLITGVAAYLIATTFQESDETTAILLGAFL